MAAAAVYVAATARVDLRTPGKCAPVQNRRYMPEGDAKVERWKVVGRQALRNLGKLPKALGNAKKEVTVPAEGVNLERRSRNTKKKVRFSFFLERGKEGGVFGLPTPHHNTTVVRGILKSSGAQKPQPCAQSPRGETLAQGTNASTAKQGSPEPEDAPAAAGVCCELVGYSTPVKVTTNFDASLYGDALAGKNDFEAFLVTSKRSKKKGFLGIW